MHYFVGIDTGGTRTKAAVFDEKGRMMASAGLDTPLKTNAQGWQERDMEALWQATVQVIRKAVTKSGVAPEDIAGVGCTGHGKGLYLWGKDGAPACHAFASTDRRGEEIVERWNADGTGERASRLTLQPVTAGQPAPLLAWLKAHRPEVYGNIRWIFEAKDYLRFRLTGEARAEYTDYSGTSLMDLNKRAFSPELLELFGIPEVAEALPPLCRSDEFCGGVSREAARATGIPAGVPVCGGMFDIDACAIAAGIVDGGDLCVIAGTWSINEYISPTPVLNHPTTRNSIYCIPEFYLIEESSPTSSGNLEWVRSLLGGVSYDEINRMVAEIPPQDSDVIFVPYLYGSNVEGCDCGAFFGLRNAHTSGDLLRAVYEGVVYSHRIHIDALRQGRTQPGALRLSGGAANSPVWAQMFADVLNCRVELMPSGEPGALGCAMAAAVASGIYDDYSQAAAAMVPPAAVLEPNPERVPVYERKYRRFLRLVEAVRGL